MNQKKMPGAATPGKENTSFDKFIRNEQNRNPKNPQNCNVEVALKYAALGWLVLPVKPRDKTPLTAHGLKDATTDHKVIKRWFARWPDANIAIRTGPESGFAVLDIDVKSGGFDSLEMLAHKHGVLPDTMVSKTGGGGRHYFFKYPINGFKNSAGKIAPGVDTRGDGGYVVAPPSIHSSGRQYEWQDVYIDKIKPTDLAEVPSWLLGLLTEPKQNIPKQPDRNGDGKIKPGSRNNDLTSLAGKLRRDGLAPAAIQAALLEHNKTKCDPRLPEKEVKTIAASVSKYESSQPEGKNQGDGNREERPTQAQALISLAEGVEFFHDAEDDSYATVPVDGHRENWRVRSRGFKSWLLHKFYKATKKGPSCQAVADAIGVLEAKARFGGEEGKTSVRIAESNGSIFVDLCNKNWQAVEITSSGWHVVDPPIKFIRSKGMLPIPVPVVGGSVDELRPLVNVEDSEWPLVVGFLVAALKETGPYPILILQGEQGSAKSTFARLLRSLVDPSTAPLRTIPREERDLLISAKNGWCLVFDNLSGLAPWLSDSLCRLSTGGGFATRQLYSDSEETLFDSQRPLVLNGIDNLTARGDLRDRALILNLPVIREENRLDEKTLFRKFEAIRPRVFGALLNAVSCALKNEGNVKLETMPRMADFARWVVAAEPALGWKPGTFMEVYGDNISASVELGLENDLIAEAVLNLTREDAEWQGSCTELLDILAERVSEKMTRAKAWPKTPAILSSKLRRLAPTVRRIGVEIRFNRKAHTGRRVISIGRSTQNSVTTVTHDGNVFKNNGLVG